MADLNWSAFALWVGGWFIASSVASVITFVLMERLRRDYPEQSRPSPLSPETFRTINRWVAENPWYAEPALNFAAQQIHIRLTMTYPEIPLEENLAMVTAEMRRIYPKQCGGKLN